MTRLFGRDGLLSKLGATILFVTYSTRWETIADSVITLDGSGGERGPHRRYSTTRKRFKRLCILFQECSMANNTDTFLICYRTDYVSLHVSSNTQLVGSGP